MEKIKIVYLMIVFSSSLFSQNEWTLQPWMQVEGKYNGQKLGSSVGFAGKIADSTKVTVGDVNGIQMFHIKNPNDTVPRFFFTGNDCSLGDFNGDGIKDLVVSGDPTKIYRGISQGVFDTIPFFIKNQEIDGYRFGLHTAIGKINGDNFDDLVISDRGYPNGNNVGRVYIFFGGIAIDTIPKYVLNGDSIRTRLGENIAVGDLNNDGFDDVIVRGYDSNNPVSSQRFAYIKIFLGGNTIDTTVWKYIKGTNDLGDVASFDVNGDGIDDLLWSNIDTLSTVYIHFGKTNIDSIPNMKLKNPGVGGLGDVIVNGGDMNGDGYNDIVTGAPGNGQDIGIVLVYSGGPKIDANYDAAASLSVQSQFGYSINNIEDINYDGYSDIIVGAPRFQWEEYRGKWFILLGDKNIPVTEVKEDAINIPSDFILYQNYPNPFNASTKISYEIIMPSLVVIKITDVLGREIRTLVNEKKPTGKYEISFDANDLPSGIYFYKMVATDRNDCIITLTKKMMLIK